LAVPGKKHFYKLIFLVCVFILSWNLNCKAQTLHTLQGKIFEKSSPVELADIFLFSPTDTLKAIKSTVSDSTGHFTFPRLDSGNYFLKVRMMGYLPFSFAVRTDSVQKEMSIYLTADSRLLNAIEIVSHKDLIKKTPQGFIIQAKDNITQIGGTATDLLRNIPTVMVDAEGNISIRGKNPLILINGRNSSIGSTDRIPAASIESIEIINNPSAQYDADADGGIINIRLKKNTARGTNCSVALGGGYGAKGRVNSSFIINHQSGAWNFGLAYDNRFAGRTRKANADRIDFDLPTAHFLSQNRFDNRLEQTQNLRLNVNYSPGKKNSFNFELIGNLDGQDNDETLVSALDDSSNAFVSKNSRRSIEIGREKVAEAAFTYNRKFTDPRKTLAVNLSSSFNRETENTNITTQSLSQSNDLVGDPFLQRTYNYQNSNVSNFKVDFIQPLSKRAVLETGYKGITRFTNADFQSQYYQNDSYVANPRASNIFRFAEQVHAGYFQFRSYIGKPDSAKIRYDIGIRLEQVFNHGEGVSNGISVTRQYFNYFPSANVLYYTGKENYLKLSFSRRINRPGLGQLNPFIDITDSLNPHGGNPYLRPELINSMELGYSATVKKISFSASAFYRYATNIIRPYIYLESNGVALTLPMNFGNSQTYGAEGMLTCFVHKCYSFNLSGSVYRQIIDGSNIDASIVNDVVSYYGKLIHNITLWKNSKLQIISNYASPVPTPQGTRIAIYNTDVGFQQKFLRNKGGIGIVVTDIFNTQRSGLNAYSSEFEYHRTFKVDTRAVLVTFAYSFGTSFRESMVENKFSND
jgi:hypothetical protein